MWELSFRFSRAGKIKVERRPVERASFWVGCIVVVGSRGMLLELRPWRLGLYLERCGYLHVKEGVYLKKGKQNLTNEKSPLRRRGF